MRAGRTMLVTTWQTIPYGEPVDLCPECEDREPGLMGVSYGAHEGRCQRCSPVDDGSVDPYAE